MKKEGRKTKISYQATLSNRSGLSSCRVTSPDVSFSISLARSAGTRLISHCLIAIGSTPSFLASAALLPKILIAFFSPFMAKKYKHSVYICKQKTETNCLYQSYDVISKLFVYD